MDEAPPRLAQDAGFKQHRADCGVIGEHRQHGVALEDIDSTVDHRHSLDGAPRTVPSPHPMSRQGEIPSHRSSHAAQPYDANIHLSSPLLSITVSFRTDLSPRFMGIRWITIGRHVSKS